MAEKVSGAASHRQARAQRFSKSLREWNLFEGPSRNQCDLAEMRAIFWQPVVYPASPRQFKAYDLLASLKPLSNRIAPIGVQRSEVIPYKDELSHLN